MGDLWRFGLKLGKYSRTPAPTLHPEMKAIILRKGGGKLMVESGYSSGQAAGQ